MYNINAALNIAKVSFSNVQSQLNRIDAQFNTSTRRAQSFADALALKGISLLPYTIASVAVIKLTESISQATRDAIKFETEMAKIAQTLDKSNKATRREFAFIGELSQQFAISAPKLAQVARTLAQAGLGLQQIKGATDALAKSTVLASFDSIDNTTEGLIAVFSQFKSEANDAGKVIALLNTLSKKYAVESSDLVEAVKKAGGAFSATGGSLEQLLTAFTTVRNATRESAESIAVGIRTISARLQRVSTSKFFKSIGIEIRDAKDNFIGFEESIKAIQEGIQKQGISSKSPLFAQIIEQLGGVLQQSRVIPLLRERAKFQEIIQARTESLADSERDAAKVQETLGFKIAETQQNFAALFREIESSQSFQFMIKSVLALTNGLIELARVGKDVLPILTSLFAATVIKDTVARLGARPSTGLLTSAAAATAGGALFLGSGFAKGGPVGGSGNKDSVPAMLMPGEYVLPKALAQKIGYDKLDALRNGVQHFAGGGKVEKIDKIVQSKGVTGAAAIQLKNKLNKMTGAQIADMYDEISGGSQRPATIIPKSTNKLLDTSDFFKDAKPAGTYKIPDVVNQLSKAEVRAIAKTKSQGVQPKGPYGPFAFPSPSSQKMLGYTDPLTLKIRKEMKNASSNFTGATRTSEIASAQSGDNQFLSVQKKLEDSISERTDANKKITSEDLRNSRAVVSKIQEELQSSTTSGARKKQLEEQVNKELEKVRAAAGIQSKQYHSTTNAPSRTAYDDPSRNLTAAQRAEIRARGKAERLAKSSMPDESITLLAGEGQSFTGPSSPIGRGNQRNAAYSKGSYAGNSRFRPEKIPEFIGPAYQPQGKYGPSPVSQSKKDIFGGVAVLAGTVAFSGLVSVAQKLNDSFTKLDDGTRSATGEFINSTLELTRIIGGIAVGGIAQRVGSQIAEKGIGNTVGRIFGSAATGAAGGAAGGAVAKGGLLAGVAAKGKGLALGAKALGAKGIGSVLGIGATGLALGIGGGLALGEGFNKLRTGETFTGTTIEAVKAIQSARESGQVVDKTAKERGVKFEGDKRLTPKTIAEAVAQFASVNKETGQLDIGKGALSDEVLVKALEKGGKFEDVINVWAESLELSGTKLTEFKSAATNVSVELNNLIVDQLEARKGQLEFIKAQKEAALAVYRFRDSLESAKDIEKLGNVIENINGNFKIGASSRLASGRTEGSIRSAGIAAGATKNLIDAAIKNNPAIRFEAIKKQGLNNPQDIQAELRSFIEDTADRNVQGLDTMNIEELYKTAEGIAESGGIAQKALVDFAKRSDDAVNLLVDSIKKEVNARLDFNDSLLKFGEDQKGRRKELEGLSSFGTQLGDIRARRGAQIGSSQQARQGLVATSAALTTTGIGLAASQKAGVINPELEKQFVGLQIATETQQRIIKQENEQRQILIDSLKEEAELEQRRAGAFNDINAALSGDLGVDAKVQANRTRSVAERAASLGQAGDVAGARSALRSAAIQGLNTEQITQLLPVALQEAIRRSQQAEGASRFTGALRNDAISSAAFGQTTNGVGLVSQISGQQQEIAANDAALLKLQFDNITLLSESAKIFGGAVGQMGANLDNFNKNLQGIVDQLKGASVALTMQPTNVVVTLNNAQGLEAVSKEVKTMVMQEVGRQIIAMQQGQL